MEQYGQYEEYEEEDYEGQRYDSKDSCPICHKEMLRTSIPKHIKKKHAPDDPAECPFCYKIFKTSYNMRDHIKFDPYTITMHEMHEMLNGH